jgi:transcriptional regulator with XRE-family HTH domain
MSLVYISRGDAERGQWSSAVPCKTAGAAARNDETLGLRPRRLRKEKGLTQVQLAQAASSAQALVSRYEADQVLPHTDAAPRIADALGVSTDELLGRGAPKKTDDLASPSRRFLKRLPLVDKLTKRDVDALLKMVDAFLAARSSA